MTTRTAYIQGLHQLATLLEQNPSIPLPLYGMWSVPIGVFVQDDIEPALTLRALMTSTTTKRAMDATWPVEITGRLSGLLVQVRIAAEIALLPGVVVPVPADRFDPRLGDVA